MSTVVTLSNKRFSFGDRLKAGFLLIAHNHPLLIFFSFFPLSGVALLWLALSRNKPIDGVVIGAVVMCFLFVPTMTVVGTLITHYGTRAAREAFSYRFDDSGVHVEAVTIDFTHRWAAIRKVRSVGNFLMLFYARGMAHCIPSEWLSPEERRAILELAARNGVDVAARGA